MQDTSRLQPTRFVPKEAVILCTDIWNGHKNAHIISYYLEYLCMHLPEIKLIPGLQWLLKKGIKGQLFIEYVTGSCNKSGLELLRNITKGLEQEKGNRPLHMKDMRL